MFWLLLLCHFLADYPLQTDGMVIAKKQFKGLFMHVYIHFVVLLAILFVMTELDIARVFVLAVSISIFHFGIDHWKNVLSQLRPSWVIFSYIQDQILHLLSIFIVSFFYSRYSMTDIFHIENLMVFYMVGWVLSTHFWFVTERVLIYKNRVYCQWVNRSMWSRMMSRGMLYTVLFIGNGLACLALLIGSIILGWNDLKPENRMTVLALDLGGVMLLVGVMWHVGKALIEVP